MGTWDRSARTRSSCHFSLSTVPACDSHTEVLARDGCDSYTKPFACDSSDACGSYTKVLLLSGPFRVQLLHVYKYKQMKCHSVVARKRNKIVKMILLILVPVLFATLIS